MPAHFVFLRVADSDELGETVSLNSVSLDNPRELRNFMYNTAQPPDASILDEAIQAAQIAVDLEGETHKAVPLACALGLGSAISA